MLKFISPDNLAKKKISQGDSTLFQYRSKENLIKRISMVHEILFINPKNKYKENKLISEDRDSIL